MKLFRNPVFAVVFCLVIIISSTVFGSVSKLERKYQSVCDNLCDAMIDYAAQSGDGELSSMAHSARGEAKASIKDMHGLILQYEDSLPGNSGFDTKSVDKAIKSFNGFLDKLDRFPAALYYNYLHLF